jgi:predicted nucleotidyltransferase
MPVRSLSSSVLKWPNRTTVDSAVRRWAEKVSKEKKDIRKIGYFGSYARGDWGVGSDLDLIVILDKSDQPMEKRAANWDTTELPVPADLLIYTTDEWREMIERGRFGRTLIREAVWVYTGVGSDSNHV